MYWSIVGISAVTEAGHSLAGASCYLTGVDPISVPHKVFWRTMMFFLGKHNEKFRKIQARKNKKG